MALFDDIQDVKDWLEPFDYLSFWEAVAPFHLFSMGDRDHCDRLISGGKVRPEKILAGLKCMALVGLRDRLDLQPRRFDRQVRESLGSVH